MPDDPIVAEVRRVRAAHAAQFDNDIERIYQAIKVEEHRSGRKFRSYPSRPASMQRRGAPLEIREQRQKYGEESEA